MAKIIKLEYLNAALKTWEPVYINMKTAQTIVPFHDKLNLPADLAELDVEDDYAVISFGKDYSITVRDDGTLHNYLCGEEKVLCCDEQ